MLSAAQHGHGWGRPLVQHLREVAELGQLPGPAHAGALRGEALQVYRLRAVLHHQREHAQVGAPRAGRPSPFTTIGNMHGWVRADCIRHLEPGAGLTESRAALWPSCPKAGGGLSCAEKPELVLSACLRSLQCVRGVCSRWPAIPGLGLWLMGDSSG